VRDVLAVHRLEFPFSVNYLCYASWGACFAVGDAEQLLDFPVLGAMVVNLLLIVAAMVLNTAADVRTDELHRERRHLVGAARRFGRDRAVRWAATEMTVAMLLAGLVAAWSACPAVVAVAAAVIVIQVFYNVEPVRLKRRGLTGVAVFCVSVIVLPFLLSYWVVRSEVDAPVLAIVGGLWLLAVGRMTLWSVPDLAADTTTGMRTPVVRYGSTGAVALSVTVVIAGLVLTGWGLWWRFGPAWALPLVALQGAVLFGAVTPSSRRIRRRAMPPVTIGAVALTVTPLIAP
jgi:lycopene elongase/hydratase (dihydrobisanhydrobacterioruberin-forming)